MATYKELKDFFYIISHSDIQKDIWENGLRLIYENKFCVDLDFDELYFNFEDWLGGIYMSQNQWKWWEEEGIFFSLEIKEKLHEFSKDYIAFYDKSNSVLGHDFILS